jgi:hypothetical protein
VQQVADAHLDALGLVWPVAEAVARRPDLHRLSELLSPEEAGAVTGILARHLSEGTVDLDGPLVCALASLAGRMAVRVAQETGTPIRRLMRQQADFLAGVEEDTSLDG